MLGEMYSILKAHITQEVGGLNLIDLDLQQYDQLGEDHVPTTPAVYIGFKDHIWDQHSKGIQICHDLPFTITLISQTAYGDSRDITDTVLINHMEYQKNLFKALQGASFRLSDHPDNIVPKGDPNDCILFQNINRRFSQPHQRISNLVKTVDEYTAQLYDYSAAPYYQQITGTIDIKCEIEFQNE